MDDLMKQFRHGVEQVVSSTQKELSEFQLKSTIRDLEAERSGKLALVGEKVLALRAAGSALSFEDLATEIAAVDDVDARLAEKRTALAGLKPGG